MKDSKKIAMLHKCSSCLIGFGWLCTTPGSFDFDLVFQ